MIESVCDVSTSLCERVLAAIADKTSVNIIGSGSKAFYGRPLQGEPLPVALHRGIISYEPTELVITARCGTRLADIESALAERGHYVDCLVMNSGITASMAAAVLSRRSHAQALHN